MVGLGEGAIGDGVGIKERGIKSIKKEWKNRATSGTSASIPLYLKPTLLVNIYAQYWASTYLKNRELSDNFTERGNYQENVWELLNIFEISGNFNNETKFVTLFLIFLKSQSCVLLLKR